MDQGIHLHYLFLSRKKRGDGKLRIGKKHLAYAALGIMSGLVILLAVSPLMGIRFDVVLSGSMSPALNTGDLAVVVPTDMNDLRVGDVIVFSSPISSGLVCHRIIAIHEDDGPVFQTKGDNNEDPDPFLVEPERVVGRVDVGIPAMGYAVQWLRGPFGLLGIIALLALTFIIPSERKNKERGKEDMDAVPERGN